MPMLAYCIVDANATVDLPQTGVAGLMVEELQHGGLRCLVSRMADDQVKMLAGKDAALAFHRVVQDVFQQVAVIPFRFPTTTAEAPELYSFLVEHAAEYRECLRRLDSKVQMDIRVFWTEAGDSATGEQPQTGTDYLRRKQERQAKLASAAEHIHSVVGQTAMEWRQTDSAQGLRIHVLVARADIDLFQKQIATATVVRDFAVRVSGPWPAAEFVTRHDARP